MTLYVQLGWDTLCVNCVNRQLAYATLLLNDISLLGSGTTV